MKIPYFAGNSLAEFTKFAVNVGTSLCRDGIEREVRDCDVEAPVYCYSEKCGKAARSFYRNGSYMRQVIEGLLFVLVVIHRFRCEKCGATISRPPSFLVPYRRFTAEVMSQAINCYAEFETSYGELSDELSVVNDDGQECSAVPANSAMEFVAANDGCRPVRSTTFSWVDFMCKRIAVLVQQTEKELVRRYFDISKLAVISRVENVNCGKTAVVNCRRQKHQPEKPAELNQLIYTIRAAEVLEGGGFFVIQKLRSYFYQFAESCRDLFSDVKVILPITQTFEQVG